MKLLSDKRAAVIGGGIAGLSAARDLARLGIGVTLVEKSGALGGRAAEYGCKAVDRCVKCGACMVVEAIGDVKSERGIEILLSSSVAAAKKNGGFVLTIDKNGGSESMEKQFDAVILASGFKPFDPREKPYGYKTFPNVITNLELESMIRREDRVIRPSDGEPPDRIAFIQCVGSRDGKLGHLWCSQVCCGSALRMARWIISRRPGTWITFFYIDIQTFGKDFDSLHQTIKNEIQLTRAIPADLYPEPGDALKAFFFDPETRKPEAAVFDMTVLSIGLLPGAMNEQFASMFGVGLTEDGFLAADGAAGVFTAGTASGPMSIADAVQSAGETVRNVVGYLENS